tara:strand:- start:1975 stop:2298 length:324 start_codon:yes stop_codon:yes gene_type:complete
MGKRKKRMIMKKYAKKYALQRKTLGFDKVEETKETVVDNAPTVESIIKEIEEQDKLHQIEEPVVEPPKVEEKPKPKTTRKRTTKKRSTTKKPTTRTRKTTTKTATKS